MPHGTVIEQETPPEPVRGRWQVVDPAGNVVDSGEGIFLQATCDPDAESGSEEGR